MVTALLALGACPNSAPQPPAQPGFRCPELQWVHQLGATSVDHARSVRFATDGDILVGGGFTGQEVGFGVDDQNSVVSLSSCLAENGYVARFSREGVTRSAFRFDGCGYSQAFLVEPTASAGFVAAGLFDHEIDVLGQTFSMPGQIENPAHLWVARWSDSGALEWFVAGYVAFLSGLGGITSDAEGNLYLAGWFLSEASGLSFTNGLSAQMTWPASANDSDSFVASFEPARGGGRWVQVFGTPGLDAPGQMGTSAGQVLAALGGSSENTWTFDPARVDSTFVENGSSLARWNAANGAWQQARHVAEPTSPATFSLAASTQDRFLTGTTAARGNTYGEGESALTWTTGPLAHGLISEWSSTDLTWQRQALLDEGTESNAGYVYPDWLDARSDGWAVVSGMMANAVTLTTDPPQTVFASSDGGDGYVGLLDPELQQRCAWWMPGPEVERVRAAIDDKGGIAVVGSFTEITLEPGTEREVNLTAAGSTDGFVAYFAPPDGAVQ